MPKLTKDDAHRIAQKLGTKPNDPKKSRLTVELKSGSAHDLVRIWYKQVFVGRFGIQRTSKKDAQHNYIPEQIHLTRSQGADFASCTLSIDEYINILLGDESIKSQLEAAQKKREHPGKKSV